MEYIAVLLVAAAAFGVCFLVDKAFTKLFRSKSQHHSGKAVRLNKRYASIGLILTAFGIGALIYGVAGQLLLIAGGVLIVVLGIGLIVYYLSFGIFYDADSFILTTFGKRSTTYQYKDIQGQQLYITTGNVTVIELYMADGRTCQIQSVMPGAYAFLDFAFEAWLRQTDRKKEDCDFHDPKNSCWFPTMEG